MDIVREENHSQTQRITVLMKKEKALKKQVLKLAIDGVCSVEEKGQR
jgi:hypothetical protein